MCKCIRSCTFPIHSINLQEAISQANFLHFKLFLVIIALTSQTRIFPFLSKLPERFTLQLAWFRGVLGPSIVLLVQNWHQYNPLRQLLTPGAPHQAVSWPTLSPPSPPPILIQFWQNLLHQSFLHCIFKGITFYCSAFLTLLWWDVSCLKIVGKDAVRQNCSSLTRQDKTNTAWNATFPDLNCTLR